MIQWLTNQKWWQLARYYFAGIINMMFAYVLFVILVALGMQIYVAQAVGYVLGVAFNYVTYSRIAFTGQEANKASYIASYVLNYLIGLLFLWIALKFIVSPYLAGLVVTVAVSLVNYFILKRLVFRAPEPA